MPKIDYMLTGWNPTGPSMLMVERAEAICEEYAVDRDAFDAIARRVAAEREGLRDLARRPWDEIEQWLEDGD